MAELAPAVARRVDGFTAEHQAGPALLADVGEKLGAGGLPNIPLIVLTGDENFSEPQDQAIWAAMHAELAELSEHSKHIHVASGHEMPLSNPGAVTDAITEILDGIKGRRT